MKAFKLILCINLLLSLFGCKSRFNENGLDFEPGDEIISYQDSMYYKQLNQYEKSIYQSLFHACIYGTEEFEVGIKFNDSYITRAVDAFNFDFPQLYWYRSYSYKDCGNYINIKQNYVDDIQKCMDLYHEIENIATDIALQCVAEYQYDTIKNIHDYLVTNVTYVEDCEYNQDIRSVFLNHEAVCAGFSYAFQYLCNLCGYECYCIHGDSFANANDSTHLWNCIKLGDTFYYVDVTWDNIEESGIEQGPFHFYFLTTEEIFRTDHIFDLRFQYPTCDDNSIYFYDEPGIYLDEFNTDGVTNLLVYWANEGYNQVYFKCSSQDLCNLYADWLNSDYGFERIFRKYIDRYSAFGWNISRNEASNCIIFSWYYC